MKYFIYLDLFGFGIMLWVSPVSFFQGLQKERWNIKGYNLGRKIIIIKKTRTLKKKGRGFFQQDFFFQLQKMV